MTEEALSPVKRALLEIRELKAKLAATREPIAIVGAGMRLPGGITSSDGLGALLWEGRSAVGPIPEVRWRLDGLYSDDLDAPGKLSTRFGGFVDDADRFDAEFFGISPREADSMDPQQRMLLEVGWQALEDAGRSPAALAGSRTGVYLGICNNDYGRALFAHRELIDPYFSTGNAPSVASGRISYFLGLQGPSVSIDTACSSSLVALHLACHGLRQRDCDMALAGGVNLILTPEMNISFSKARMMAPDGRCKTFDAKADGYVRSEGVGLLVLRRLADAIADGDRVLAVVRGTAINQDGRSGGLTAPNGPAQEDVIRRALEAADVAPREVGYVEAHGTGTPLGDPIEIGALGAALCGERAADQPLVVGSVKTNLGHLEAVAGFAGVMKVALALQRREIPAHLNFDKGNEHIDWSLPIRVPTARLPWPAIEGRRIAGVSSFGFSGTNAHVVLEEAPPLADRPPAADRPRHIVTLSARTEGALKTLAAAYAARLASEPLPVGDIAFTANAGRAHFAHRLAVLGKTGAEIASGLARWAGGEADSAIASAAVRPNARPKVAFLFTGQGAQCVGMGKLLYETSPAFKRTIDACAAAAKPLLERDLLEVMFRGDKGDPTINTSAYAQPATFAIEVAIAELWRSWGVEPEAVTGHSFGEYAAACVAGLFSLDDGMRLAIERGRIADALPPGGAMATVFASPDVVARELARTPGVSIGVYNGPEHVVVSGPRPAVEAMLGRLEGAGVKVKLLRIPYASHSPHVEPALAPFRKVLEPVAFRTPRVPLVSNLTGDFAGVEELGRPEYWLSHMREAVRFHQGMTKLAERGFTHFIEVGPHPVLLGIGAECLPDVPAEWLPSLHREREDWTDLLESLQRLYVGGADIDWSAFDRDHARRRVALPTYPFEKTRHWMSEVDAAPTPPKAATSATERWSLMQGALERESERVPVDLDVTAYPAIWEVLGRLTIAHAAKVLRGVELFGKPGEAHRLDDVLARAKIAPTYCHLVKRWLDRLVATGALRRDGERYASDRPLAMPELAPLWAETERALRGNSELLAYLKQCGGLLGEVITGKESPLETLFPGGSWDLAEGLYRRSTTMRYINGVAAAAFEALAGAGGTLRVLEIGAGTGGTTASLLPMLLPDHTRYLYTDVSDLFLERARETFAAYPFVEYAPFDFERDPSSQGHAPGSFDVVVAADAVHASADLRLTLGRLRELLAPGGVLVLVESTTHFEWFDMTIGLVEGWQAFLDDLRTDNPLLPPARWVEALQAAGFVEAGAWPKPGSPASLLGHHVVVGRAPGEVVHAALPAASSSGVATPAEGPPKRAAGFKERVLAALPDDRLDLVRDLVRARVMDVLRLDRERPPSRDARLMDLGFDSLMAVKLRNVLTTALALDKRLPATLLFDYPTIDALAARLLDLAMPKAAPEAPTNAAVKTKAAPPPDVVGAAAIEAMSEEEVERLLLERLERGEP